MGATSVVMAGDARRSDPQRVPRVSATKLACATAYDPCDPGAYGGRIFHHLQALQSQVTEMHFLGPLSYLKQAPLLLAKREFYRRARHKYYHPLRDRSLVKNWSRQIARRLAKIDADVVLSPQADGSQPIAYLDCKQPIVTWTDAPWAALVDFYPDFDSRFICAETLRDAIENERAALSRVALAIYKSHWGAQSAIRLHGLDPAKTRVVPPGPCFADELTLAEAEAIVRARPRNRCRLLFVGVHWVRKGGDMALEVAKGLNQNGLPTELVLVGAPPLATDEPLPDFVRYMGFLDRQTADGAAQLRKLFETSHFLVVPSRAEANGLIFAEANAFALPSVTRDVGGISTAVRAGINGMTFPLSADANQYCAFIEDAFIRYDRYRQMALAAFAEFESRTNNRTAAAAVVKAVEELL